MADYIEKYVDSYFLSYPKIPGGLNVKMKPER